MSIRALALELYKAQKKVDELRKAIAGNTGDGVAIGRELREAEKEMVLLRKMLDGEKASGSFRQRFSGTGVWKA